jgi:hypothetical protein
MKCIYEIFKQGSTLEIILNFGAKKSHYRQAPFAE